jgi:hypothetical protein
MSDTIDTSPEATLGRAIGANVLVSELISALLSMNQSDLVDEAVKRATMAAGSAYAGEDNNIDPDKVGEFARVHIMAISATSRMKAAIDSTLRAKS